WASEPSALPLDKQGDKEYQEAVAALEAAEAPEELIEEVIPIGIPVPEKLGKRHRDSSPVLRPVRSPLETARPYWGLFLLGLGATILLVLVLFGLLSHFLRH